MQERATRVTRKEIGREGRTGMKREETTRWRGREEEEEEREHE